MATPDSARVVGFVEDFWKSTLLPLLFEYIRIKNVTVDHYTPESGSKETDEVMDLYAKWADGQVMKFGTGAVANVLHIKGRTPILMIEVPATGDAKGTILLYGHADKQPPMTNKWRAGLGPYTPVIEGDKLYGRGGADDGYAMPAAIAAIKALEEQRVPHARCVVLIEAGEESGSPDLEAYVTEYQDRIGTPDLIICLDSGCGNYDQLWLTTSLRGVISADLKVEVLQEGVHSGDASGIVPSSMRIMRMLLERIENSANGEMPPHLTVQVPSDRLAQAKMVAAALGSDVASKFPWLPGGKPVGGGNLAMVLARTWMPKLEIIAQEGIPNLADGGNVLRPSTTFRLSVRVPPTFDPAKAHEFLQKTLTENPPYGAKVTYAVQGAAMGWNAPTLSPWLNTSLQTASETYFGRPFMAMGEGGTIPFMKMLGDRFPQAEFVITGILGPSSNAHGPNEFVHIPTGKRITAVIANVIADHANKK